MSYIDWEEYKPILRRAYCNESGVVRKDSGTFDDFWAFHKKYLAVSMRNPDKHTPETKRNRKFEQFRLDKTEKYMLREVPQHAIDEFEYILHCYLAFCQKQKLAKLKKLRESQRNLPVAQYREKIVDAVRENRIVVIAGDTGCGKSTQVPQYLLEAGFDRIACTQPRRIACVSLSKRVAFETLNEYGSHVAYQIRFEKTKTQATRLLFLTEGLLLRQLSMDPLLTSYEVIVLDEIHERHIHGDFLMGVLKKLVTVDRSDLKLILMSATINIEMFSKYFDDAPVLQVPGRLYPIKLQYFPQIKIADPFKTKNEKIDPSPYLRTLQTIDQKYKPKERGDLLVFLSGITEITSVAEALTSYAERTKQWIILMLHSTLSLEEQDRVFDIAPEGVRKCILSTNIAETSVTIDGVRFVIDSGKAKEVTYDPESHMQRLKEQWISKASAEQRKGRAGRTGPGNCFRLYSNEEFDKLIQYSMPEIARISLESLVLQMVSIGLPNAREFDFIERPPAEAMDHAIDRLIDHGAIRSVDPDDKESECSEELTSMGRMLSSLPVDVPIGKMLILGCLFRQVEAVLTMAAALSVQSPFTNRSFKDADCQALRRPLVSDHGDAFTLLNIYREWLEIKADGREVTSKWCKRRGIEEQRLYDITKLRSQFKELLEDGELMEKVDNSMTATERRLRQGEIKKLREMKRKAQNVQKKRKVLKMDDKIDAVHADEQEHEQDEASVSAVEFQIRHSNYQIEKSLQHYKMDYAGLSVMKMITCSALYPQYGILDEHNVCRPGHDQFLHTKAKAFVVLHPNSCLALDPDVLQKTVDGQGFSTHHQLIFYSLLLETIKPYIVNSVRVPALHTLLLFARSVDTNIDCSRIVFDNWIDVTCDEPGEMQMVLVSAARLRQSMSDSMERKLSGDSYSNINLAADVMRYLKIEVRHTLKRLMKADQNTLYVGTEEGFSGASINELPSDILGQFQKTIRKDRVKGGVALTDSLTFGCLREEGVDADQKEHYLTSCWTCPECNEEMRVTPVQRLDHLNSCGEGASAVGKVENEDSAVKSENPLARKYLCNVCNKTLSLTSVEILKHKRSHK